MKFEDLLKRYSFNDGETLGLTTDFRNKTISILLNVRRFIRKKKLEKCLISLEFIEATTFDIIEDFTTAGSYSDIKFLKNENGEFYISIDPYDNTSNSNQRDNFVIKSNLLTIVNEFGDRLKIE